MVGLFGTKPTYLRCVGEMEYNDHKIEPSVNLFLTVEESRFVTREKFVGTAIIESGDAFFPSKGYFIDKSTGTGFLWFREFGESGSVVGKYDLHRDELFLDSHPSFVRYEGQCEKYTPALL